MRVEGIGFCLSCHGSEKCERCQIRARLHRKVEAFPIGDLDRQIVELSSRSELDFAAKTELRYLLERFRRAFGHEHVTRLSHSFTKLLSRVADPAIGF